MSEKISWNTTRLSAVAALGVLGFIINVGIGLPIIMATGIPAGAFPVILFVFPVMVILCGLIIPLFPSCTIAMAVWLTLALSVPIMGPAGFFPKIIVGISAGLSADILFLFLKEKRKLLGTIGGAGVDIAALLITVVIFSIFLPPNMSSKFTELLPKAFILALLLGPIGGIIGQKIFEKIQNRAIVVRLRGK